jgi:signal transduction histidine kinase
MLPPIGHLIRHAALSTTAAAGLLCGAMPGATRAADIARWISPKVRQIDAERQALEQTLAALPPAPTPHLTERLGYHSGYSPSPDTVEWVEMDLGREENVDAVVLIAAPSDSGDSASAGYGFPVRFRVELSDKLDGGERAVIADHTAEDFPNPGALPVFLDAHGRKARYARITATRLYREDQRYLFALGEVMILQGKRNLAVRVARSDFTYSRTTGAMPVWGLSNLVDGHTVLGPPVGSQPSPTLGYKSQFVNLAKEPTPEPRWVQVDLGATLPLQEVRLFPAHPPEFAHRPGYGWPPIFKVEAANHPDFSDAIELAGFSDDESSGVLDNTNPGDNVITVLAHGESARYVRFTALRLFNSNGRFNFALSEMQVWSDGKNVALGQPVSAFDSFEGEGWSKAALVDGFNSQANIPDWSPWLAGLSRRRETLQQLAVLDSRRTTALRRLQREGWWLLAGTAATGLALLIASLIAQQRQRRQEMEALRQRISRDLHDEIGSSLGSIALISQEVMATADDPEQVRRELAEIQSIARQTVDSMRDIALLVQSERYGQGDLTLHLREIAARMLRGLPHTLKLEARNFADSMPMDRQRDLVLMFKEALHNILKHARAKEVSIALTQSQTRVTLTVQDDGRGFDAKSPAPGGMGLSNLRRRAAKHGGSVEITAEPGRGVTLAITLPTHA